MGEVIQLFKDQPVVETSAGQVDVEHLIDAVVQLQHEVSCLETACNDGTAAEFWQWMAAVKRTASLLPSAPGDG
jgi:hypothetical protein